jgi:hypothetical protein
MSSTPREMTAWQRWLDALPATNWKLWWGVVLLVLTFAADMLGGLGIVAWSMTHDTARLDVPDIVGTLIEAWHWTLAGFLGFGLGQFAVKRATYKAPSPDQQAAGVPASPPPASLDGQAATSSVDVVAATATPPDARQAQAEMQAPATKTIAAAYAPDPDAEEYDGR